MNPLLQEESGGWSAALSGCRAAVVARQIVAVPGTVRPEALKTGTGQPRDVGRVARLVGVAPAEEGAVGECGQSGEQPGSSRRRAGS